MWRGLLLPLCVLGCGSGGASDAGVDATSDASSDASTLDVATSPNVCALTVTGAEQFDASCEVQLYFNFATVPAVFHVNYGDAGASPSFAATLATGSAMIPVGSYATKDFSGSTSVRFVGADGRVYDTLGNLGAPDGGTINLQLLSLDGPPPPNNQGLINATSATHGSLQAHLPWTAGPDAGGTSVDVSATF